VTLSDVKSLDAKAYRSLSVWLGSLPVVLVPISPPVALVPVVRAQAE
jgi:hypothetical protein